LASSSVEAEDDQLRRAVAEVHVIDPHPGNVLFLRVVHHCLARREQALAVGVARAGRQIADHVLHDLVGRLEAEHSQVADVQLDDLVALLLHLAGLLQHRTTDVIADIGEFAGLGNRLHLTRSLLVEADARDRCAAQSTI
jgi:hypothetical protein